MMLFCLLQFLFGFFYIIFGPCDIGFNGVNLLPLSLDKHRQLIEHRNTLVHRRFEFLYIPELILNVTNCVFQRNTSLTIDFPLEHFLRQLWIFNELFHLLFCYIPIN